jgi:glycerophosphoryl diester phosphodiesterase
MARLRGGRLRWVIAGVLVVALAAGVIAAGPVAQRYTGAAPPAQFYEKVQPDPALARDHPRVLGVAHNAGNNLGTLATALRYGADVIEIDVISARGQLVAGRDQPWPWLARRLFRGPTLTQAWDHAAAAGTIKLDLMHQHKLLILAWTVNDSQRFNQLVRLGVDGITTANLAILRALEKEP